MKKFKLQLLIFLFTIIFIGFSYPAFAEKTIKESIWDDIIIENFRTNNPFKPQLPVSEVIQKIIPIKDKPDKIKSGKKALWDRINQIKPKTPEFFKPKKEEIIIIPPSLTITGLIWNTDRPQAIINGKIVDIGDTVSATKIVAIRKNGIDVFFNGKTLTIAR